MIEGNTKKFNAVTHQWEVRNAAGYIIAYLPHCMPGTNGKYETAFYLDALTNPAHKETAAALIRSLLSIAEDYHGEKISYIMSDPHGTEQTDQVEKEAANILEKIKEAREFLQTLNQ